MARHKSFGSINPYAEQEPVSFDIYGETFMCRPAVQGFELLRFANEVGDKPNEAILSFFHICMNEAEYLRFQELLEDPDKIVDAQTLGEIAGYLVGEYSARPTKPSSSSSSGQGPIGRTSPRKR
jgi:hypothetical protein